MAALACHILRRRGRGRGARLAERGSVVRRGGVGRREVSGNAETADGRGVRDCPRAWGGIRRPRPAALHGRCEGDWSSGAGAETQARCCHPSGRYPDRCIRKRRGGGRGGRTGAALGVADVGEGREHAVEEGVALALLLLRGGLARRHHVVLAPDVEEIRGGGRRIRVHAHPAARSAASGAARARVRVRPVRRVAAPRLCADLGAAAPAPPDRAPQPPEPPEPVRTACAAVRAQDSVPPPI
mgnify:CR=1 FL=1